MSINTEGKEELRKAIVKMAEKCTAIPECPRSEAAIEAIADDLEAFCEDPDEALWLVTEARRNWETWQGSAGLQRLLIDRRHVRPELRTIDLGPKPAIQCRKCHDWGTRDDANGEAVYCDCPSAEYPRSIRLIERFKAARTKIPRAMMPPSRRGPAKVITQEDVDHAVQDRKDRNARTVASARKIIDNPDSTSDQIAMAEAILRNYGAEKLP